jgi:hypothetical protein
MAKLADASEPGEDRDGYVRLSAVWTEMAQLAEKLEAALAEGKT